MNQYPTLENFVMTPPPALKLPAPSGEDLPYYDRSAAPGMRCLWTFDFLIWKNEEQAGHVLPDHWRYDGHEPSPEYLPDEYLLEELRDITCRNLEGFSLGAAKLIAAYVKNGSAGERAEFRGRAIPLLVNVRVNPPQAISRYNPPAKKALNFSSLPIWDIPKDDPRRARRR